MSFRSKRKKSLLTILGVVYLGNICGSVLLPVPAYLTGLFESVFHTIVSVSPSVLSHIFVVYCISVFLIKTLHGKCVDLASLDSHYLGAS